MIIKSGNIHNAVDREAFVADILIKDGKIVAIDKDIDVCGEEVIDATGKEVYPGFVEAHCHIGISGRVGRGNADSECNERTDVTTPHIRAIDGVDPSDDNFVSAREAGVTCVCTGPGSSNVIGGTFIAMKTAGICVDEMAVKPEVAMKCAFGENIKNNYKGKSAGTRMTVASVLRGMLAKARIYKEKIDEADGDKSKYPAYDQKLEALLPVMRGEMPLKMHVHQANDIFTAIRIAEEFDVKYTLEHATDGHLISEYLAEKNASVAIGPTLINGVKVEFRNKSWETPGVLANCGCNVCITTDSEEAPQETLPLCAGFAIKAGMDEFDALCAITINAAKHIGVEDRVGSIEVGKDADIVIADDKPFKILTKIEVVLIDGKIVSDKR